VYLCVLAEFSKGQSVDEFRKILERSTSDPDPDLVRIWIQAVPYTMQSLLSNPAATSTIISLISCDFSIFHEHLLVLHSLHGAFAVV